MLFFLLIVIFFLLQVRNLVWLFMSKCDFLSQFLHIGFKLSLTSCLLWKLRSKQVLLKTCKNTLCYFELNLLREFRLNSLFLKLVFLFLPLKILNKIYWFWKKQENINTVEWPIAKKIEILLKQPSAVKT